MKENKQTNRFTRVLFALYLVILCWVILFKLNIQFTSRRNINLIPYNEPLILNGQVDMGEIILNVLAFIPMGLYVAILYDRWRFYQKALLFILISLLLEIFQYILSLGASDITDIINNTLGGIIGLVLFSGLNRIVNNRTKTQKIINVTAAIGTLFILSLYLYLKINRLWMFRM